MFKVGLSTTDKEISAELLEQYAVAGMNYMEISTDYEIYNNYDWHNFKKQADSLGVNIYSFHLPFKPFEILDMSSADKEKRQHSMKYYVELIKRISSIGINKFILHSGGKVTRKSQDEVDERIKYAKESYAFLADAAYIEGSVIAVENLPPVCVGTSIKEVKELISASPHLGVCFDTNHLLSGDAEDFIRALGDKIIATHISDYDKITEKHWMPGEGVNNWNNIYNALKDVGYSGVWMYEVGFETCRPGIERKRLLTCADFLRNAEEISSGKKPGIII